MRQFHISYRESNAWRLFWALWMMAVFFAALPAFADETPAPAPTATVETVKPFEIFSAQAEEEIGNALTEKGVGNKVSAKITNLVNLTRNGALYASDKPLTLSVKGLQFDKQSRHWNASLLFMSNNDVVTALPVSGHFEEMAEMPVLKHEVRSGDVISENDIEVHDFPMAHMHSDDITEISSLIGKTPLRSISAARPVRMHEIASPALIKKNGIVQMKFNSPGMEITTTGQALDDGAKGAVISVRNTASKKIVRAVVDDSGTVHILAPGVNLSSNQAQGADYAAN